VGSPILAYNKTNMDWQGNSIRIVASATVTYYMWSDAGTPQTSRGWLICKKVDDGTTMTITWANGEYVADKIASQYLTYDYTT
jgi:hypothetical protein